MANNVVEILKGVMGELKETARSETIIGDPVTINGRTVIPVVKLSFGFGAGGGQRDSGKADQYGGGGGGGARIEPAAFIIMDEDSVRIVPAGKGKWEQLLDVSPGVARKAGEFAEKVKDGLASKKGKGEHHGHKAETDEGDQEPSA